MKQYFTSHLYGNENRGECFAQESVRSRMARFGKSFNSTTMKTHFDYGLGQAGMAMQDYGLGLRVGLKDLPTLRTRIHRQIFDCRQN